MLLTNFQAIFCLHAPTLEVVGEVFGLLLGSCADRGCLHEGGLQPRAVLAAGAAGSRTQRFQLGWFGRGTNFHKQALDLCPDWGRVDVSRFGSGRKVV